MTQSPQASPQNPEKDGKPYRKAVSALLNQLQPPRILDIACGNGWLPGQITYPGECHGIDAYAEHQPAYKSFTTLDINEGIPLSPQKYDAAVICEAMAYTQNPGMIIKSIRDNLNPQGTIIITDPNPIYAGARLNHLVQGFPRSHCCFVDNTTSTPHMPWMQLGLFQYWFLLGINGFTNITLHDVDEEKPKHAWETLLGGICKLYYRSRYKKAKSDNERSLWQQAGSDQHIYGRRLVISATAN